MNRRNLLVAGGIFVVLLAYVIFTQTGNRAFNTIQLPALAKLSAEDMSRLEINAPHSKLVLEKSGKQWRISEPFAFAAEKYKVENLQRLLADIRITDIITEQTGRDADFGLTSATAIGLRVLGSKSRSLELTVGKANPAGTHTFVHIPGDRKVYQILGEWASALNPPAAEWRSLQVFDFSPDTVQSFSVTRGKKALLVQKVQEPDSSLVLSPTGVTTTPRPLHAVWRAEREPKALADPKVNQWLNAFTRLGANRIVDNPPAAKVIAQIQVKTLSGEQGLEFLENASKGKNYWVRRQGETVVYEIPDYQGQNLLKDAKDLL